MTWGRSAGAALSIGRCARRAKSGHSSEIFSDAAGFGASYELVRILDAFRRELREPNATYNVGLMLSGSSAALNA